LTKSNCQKIINFVQKNQTMLTILYRFCSYQTANKLLNFFLRSKLRLLVNRHSLLPNTFGKINQTNRFHSYVSVLVLVGLLFLSIANVSAQEAKYKIATVAFYNSENLFDTIDEPNVKDEEFTPQGSKRWNTKKYNIKLAHLSEVISKIGVDKAQEPPAILGISEVENISVLKDLINTPKLKPYNYHIIHYDSPDRRGIDVALLYRPKYFKVIDSKSYRLTVPDKKDFRTRDQLLVSGLLDGEQIYFIVNHWPSRYGGEKRSRPLRNDAADLCRSIADSLLKVDANAKVIMMGDLNDDPVDPSLKNHLKATDDKSLLSKGYFYNPMITLYKEGIGSLAWHDSWNLFDNMILTPALLKDSGYHFYQAHVFNKKFITTDEGRYKGYPFRTFSGDNFIGGYSDHFPVYLFLVKKIN